ncbi:MAG: bifunctional nuclease family protein [Prevotella sp.]|nr:bifunctional nuclease family protein [Prevotella sp.]
MMSKVKLKFHNVGEIVGSDELAIITLTDEPQERMITIVCDKAMAVQLELRAKQIPITRIMLPEVLAGILKDQAGIMMDILITDIIEGQYRTLLYNRVTLETMPIRASDAVLLSVAARIPIYMESSLMDRQSVRFSGLSHAISMPVNTLSTEMLDKALQKAVDDENYELASHLRDEKKRREKK